jgi:hypothetical protein
MTIEPMQRLTVELTAQQWDAVLNTLADAPAPYRVTAPLIEEIRRQCMQRGSGVPADYHGYVDAMDQRGNGEAQEVQG